MSHENQMDAAQTLGLIKGLTAVVQEQSNAMKDTTDQIKQLAATVENLTKSQPQSQSMGLHLPNLVLPGFTGKEPLDSFLERIQSLLITSNVPVQYWLTYLKQQCQKDSRAYDALNSAHEEHQKLLGPYVTKAGSAEYKALFAACVQDLQDKRGIPKDQQICELLETYYTMKQHPVETVADFAHRFCETQHNLDKLMPKIHSELELVYAFVIKLRPDISKDLISRDFHTFKTLQPLIAAAQHYESHAGPAAQPQKDNIELWQPKLNPASNHNKRHTQAANILYTNGQYQGPNSRTLPFNPTKDKSTKLCSSSPNSHRPKPNIKFDGKSKPGSQPQSGDLTHQICFHFNCNVRSGCEMTNNSCRNRRQHRCLTCNQWGCKQLNHSPQPHSNNFSHSSFKPDGTQAQVTASPPPNPNGDSCELKQILTDMKSAIQSDIHAVKSDMQSITSRIEKIEALPQSALASKSSVPQDILTKAPQFGNPAITAVPSYLDISDLDLVNKNILWT